jgi:DNA-binding transcriptional LysR family regulator
VDWDDLKFVLAVHRASSALGAARLLRVNQSTVVRRIAQIEAALGVELFARRQNGYYATSHGTQVAEAALRIEAEVLRLESALAAARRQLQGVVRLTTSETLASCLVTPFVLSLQQSHPNLRIELITDDRRLDLASGEADIALRAGSRPEGAGIVARRMPKLAWAVYCSHAYAGKHGAPASREEICRHAIVGMDGPMAQLAGPRWLAAAAPDAAIRFSSNSLINLAFNLRAGLGVAALPCILGDIDRDLRRCFAPPTELDAELWLVVREEAKSVAHVRAVADFLAERLHAIRAQLAGAS